MEKGEQGGAHVTFIIKKEIRKLAIQKCLYSSSKRGIVYKYLYQGNYVSNIYAKDVDTCSVCCVCVRAHMCERVMKAESKLLNFQKVFL